MPCNLKIITGQCKETSFSYTIQIRCVDESLFGVQKCVGSETYYTYVIENLMTPGTDITNIDGYMVELFVSRICPNITQPNYQLCIGAYKFPSLDSFLTKTKGSICSGFIGNTSYARVLGFKWKQILDHDWVCDKAQADLKYQSLISWDKDLEDSCNKNTVKNGTKLCNGFCDSSDCFDEAICNNFLYGIMCKRGGIDIYIKPGKVCNGITDCDQGEDEKEECYKIADDKNNDYLTCSQRFRSPFSCRFMLLSDLATYEQLITIYDSTRCSALDYETACINSEKGFLQEMKAGNALYPMCDTFLDQMNCTDEKRGVLTCPVNGYSTTLSAAIVCNKNLIPIYDEMYPLCDDGSDFLCTDPSLKCKVHKHQLCDGIFDCADNSDENVAECHAMTKDTCHRKYRHEIPIRLPISWLKDGIDDCRDGKDEIDSKWPTCKYGNSIRFLPDGSSCENVFSCGLELETFVEIEHLCNGMNTCSAEISVCKATRPFKVVANHAYQRQHHQNSWNKVYGPLTKFVSYCIPGVAISAGHLISKCLKETFKYPDEGIVGITVPIPILLPKNRVCCNSFYGEQYVFMACKNRCLNSTCPLKFVKADGCAGAYKDRLITITRRSSRITFVTKEKNNHIFQCNNDRCINYDQVCDLVNDCGDYSDEKSCTNVFHCVESEEFIPSTEKCNGKVQCTDYSDECSEDCGKEIISGFALKSVSWIIGMTAVVLNSVKIFSSSVLLVRDRQSNTVINLSFGLLIHFGDFLNGFYLLSIAIVDSLVYGKGYCKLQYVWLSSTMCSSLGVISTFGTQLSLFSMTFLSMYRLSEVFDLKVSDTKHLFIKITVIIATITATSLVTAIGPLIPSYEDFFVNGMTYNPKIKSFLPYVDKKTHLGVIKGYYGRINIDGEILTWKRINSLVAEMFTKDYEKEALDRRKIHFYGNNGVCLFKYFVDRNDPQINFVWSCLSINLSCFFIISICYGIIRAKSKSSNQIEDHLNQEDDRTAARRERKKTQRNIALIILTDFLCWVPFIFICGLNSLELIDATSSYPIFSLVILPINSVINPLIYGDLYGKKAVDRLKRLRMRFLSALGTHVVPDRDPPPIEEMELHVIQSRVVQDSPQPGPS